MARKKARAMWHFVLAICLIAGFPIATKAADAFESLKRLLNTNYTEYEVIFSQVHKSSLEFRAFLTKSGRPDSQGLLLDEAIFYRVRCAKDGYLIHKAESLSNILELNITQPDCTAQGVVSNNFWSADGGVLVFDPKHLEETGRRMGTTPTNWEYQALSVSYWVLSLGMYTRNGSFRWNNSDFTADISPLLPVSRVENPPKSSGHVTLENGIPSSIRYQLGSSRSRYVFLSYNKDDGAEESAVNFPSRIVTTESLPSGNGSNVFVTQLISFQAGAFPSNCTGPDEFFQPNKKLTIVQRTSPDRGKVVQVNGRTSTRPLEVGFNQGKGSERGRFSVGKMVVIAVLALLPFIFLCGLRRRKVG